MLLLASKILDSFAALGEQKIKVKDLLIDCKAGHVFALSLENQTFFSFSSISTWDGQDIIINPQADSLEVSTIKDSISIIKHKIQTESGINLGILQDFEFDPLLGEVVFYKVKPPFIGNLLPKNFLTIHRNQVIAIEKEKIIVQDSFIKIKDKIKNWHQQKGILPAGALVS